MNTNVENLKQESMEKAQKLMERVPTKSGFKLMDYGIGFEGKDGIDKITNWVPIDAVILNSASNSADGQRAKITAYIPTSGITKTVEITPAEQKNGSWLYKKLGLKFFCKDIPLLRSYIGYLLADSEEKDIITQQGWNEDVYARRTDCIGSNDYIVNAEQAFSFFSTKLSANDDERKETLTVIDTLLGCTARTGTMKMLFYTLLNSMLTSVYQRTDLPRIPQYVLMITGISGVGKTTLIKLLLSFIKNYPYFDLSTGYTESSLMKDLQIYRDNILFVDDLVNNNDKTAVDNVNKIARLFGNSGSSRKTSRSVASACCQAIITAEVEPEIPRSSLNRMIILNISKSEIDFDKVTEMKKPENRQRYAKAIGDILKYISDIGPENVVKELSESFEFFDNKINQTNDGLCQRRVEAFSWILAMERFFNKYKGQEETDNSAIYDYAVNSLKDDYIQSLYDMPEYKLCKTVIDNTTMYQDKSAEKPLSNGKWGYSGENDLYVVINHIDEIFYLCDIPITSQKSVFKSLINRNIVLFEKSRGQKYRLTVKNVGKYTTYRFNKDKAQEFIDSIERL